MNDYDQEWLRTFITINIRAERLRDRDIVGHSDAFAVLYVDAGVPTKDLDIIEQSTTEANRKEKKPGDARDGRWERVGVTETIPNNCNPCFTKSFQISYYFERAQRLAIDFYDRDNPVDEPFGRHDFLGSAECSVPTLVRARGKRLCLNLRDEGRPRVDCGVAYLFAEEEVDMKQKVLMDIELHDYKPKILSPRTGPLSLNIARPVAVDGSSDEWIVVHGGVTSTKEGNIIVFKRVRISFARLCFRDELTVLQCHVIDRKGKSVGAIKVSLSDWQSAKKIALWPPGSISLKSARPRRRAKLNLPLKDVRSLGSLFLSNYSREVSCSFLDYVAGGYQISLALAIDFTASNGDPSKPGTLHHIDLDKHNEYETAIESVCRILAQYDSDDLYPAYGFGAKLPPQFRAPSHCFSLNGSEDPTCEGVEGVMEAYRNCLHNVRFSGPTVFAEVIRATSELVQATRTEHMYSIMLIITDGVINDFEDTVDEIVRASSLPLSIVIVGVGDADFTEMNDLDSDDVLLQSSTGHSCMRDIVQFVHFRKYRGAPEVLASKVLEEIPTQFIEYMEKHGIDPPPCAVEIEETTP